MPKLRHPLTPKVQADVCAFIRKGGFADVAAAAAGIPQATFRQWLARGEKPGARDPYRSFVAAVHQARAQARVLAEIEAAKKNPVAWLKHGPGKETADLRGWTVPVRPQVTQDQSTLNLVLHPELADLFGTVLDALAAFPEARQAVTAVLAAMQAPRIARQE